MKMELTVSSETSAVRTQTPGNYPKRNKLHLFISEFNLWGGRTKIFVVSFWSKPYSLVQGGFEKFITTNQTARCRLCVLRNDAASRWKLYGVTVRERQTDRWVLSTGGLILAGDVPAEKHVSHGLAFDWSRVSAARGRRLATCTAGAVSRSQCGYRLFLLRCMRLFLWFPLNFPCLMLCTAQFVYCDAVYCAIRVRYPPYNTSVSPPFISDFPFRRFVTQNFAEIRTDDSFLNSSTFLSCSTFAVLFRKPSLSRTTGVGCRMSRRAVECSGNGLKEDSGFFCSYWGNPRISSALVSPQHGEGNIWRNITQVLGLLWARWWTCGSYYSTTLLDYVSNCQWQFWQRVRIAWLLHSDRKHLY